jgi:hypothetical protein
MLLCVIVKLDQRLAVWCTLLFRFGLNLVNSGSFVCSMHIFNSDCLLK